MTWRRVASGCATVVGAVVLSGCVKAGEPRVDAGALDDCTFETVLVEGVPGSPGHLIPSERNPNGASELATLMRTMAADLKDAKGRLLAHQPVPPLRERHRRIRCSWPTMPSDRTKDFDGFAVNYLSKVAALDQRPPEVEKAYDVVVSACRACHETTCDGPLVVIDGLKLDAKPD